MVFILNWFKSIFHIKIIGMFYSGKRGPPSIPFNRARAESILIVGCRRIQPSGVPNILVHDKIFVLEQDDHFLRKKSPLGRLSLFNDVSCGESIELESIKN